MLPDKVKAKLKLIVFSVFPYPSGHYAESCVTIFPDPTTGIARGG